MGLSNSSELDDKPIVSVIAPFYCKCCNYIWETSDRYLDHLQYFKDSKEFNKLVKICKPIKLIYPYTEEDAINIKRCIHKVKYKGIIIDEKEENINFCLNKVIKGQLKCQKHSTIKKETTVCKICKNDNSDCLIIPCNHASCCIKCSELIDKCIICKNKIENKIKINFN
jgi:hypothetical protein